MGTGSFNNGIFNFVVVTPHSWDTEEKEEWKARFIEASRVLYEASEGQLSFGHVFMADEAWGLGHAEFVVHNFPATAYATHGGYGTLGKSVQLFSNDRTGDPRTIVHEFGHHAFDLGDEYTGPVQQDEIDTEAVLPDPNFFNIVPLQPSENDSQSLQYGYAVLLFDGRVERLIVEEHTPNQVTLTNGFTQDPRTADNNRIFYQPQYNYTYPQFPAGILIRCVGNQVQNANYCLMERYRDQPGTQSVTEFCTQDNHDPDHDTSHDNIHGGLSCWQVMQQHMLDRYNFGLEAPNPAQTGQQTAEMPQFHDLVKEARIALVMDRSGSMGTDNKIQGARHGIDQWITSAHQENDFLSVIWFNQAFDTRFPLNQVDQSGMDSIIEQVNDVDPGGWTNIRDALLEAVSQIQSRDERSAVQAIVLLTDGIHNRPEGTTIAEAIPTLQDSGIPVYVIALGSPDHVDYVALEELVRETGGFMNPVGMTLDENGNPLEPEEQNALIALHVFMTNYILRNGLTSVGNQTVAGAPPDSDFGRTVSDVRDRPPPLKDLAKLQGFDDVGTYVKKHHHPYAISVPFLVEDGASTARFAMTYAQKQKFLLYLVDPENDPVDFTASSDAVLIAPESPYATAIVKKPKPGQWHAVIIRASAGPKARVNYSAGVENRMIVAHADCDREVEVGMPTSITAHAVWGDRLSGLRVTARFTGPDGSIHSVVLGDEAREEPNSGDYRGVFTPQLAGRYAGEVRIYSRGNIMTAGGLHRAVHAPQKEREPVRLDLKSKAPAFIRRIPIYFDAGKRPAFKDLDLGRRGRSERAPVRHRKNGLRALDIKKALDYLTVKSGK